jgi:hypothetical protein
MDNKNIGINPIEKLGDTTSHDTVPDFESGKGYYWMKQSYQARVNGALGNLPRKPRRTLAERSFFEAVDRRLSRSTAIVNIEFDGQGKRIKEKEETQ